MPIEDLWKMARFQAFGEAQRRRVQSSSGLRALFASAVTGKEFTPEECTLVDPRIKLQAGRIEIYGVQLKERMAAVRMFAAGATRQSNDMVDELTANVRETRAEFAEAQKAVYGGFRCVEVAKQAVKSLAGVPLKENDDPAAEADALRQDNIINDIDADICDYKAQTQRYGEHDMVR
ncbi:uncharacterized protein ALTATR162_LOCUS5126 [Alternaria atra]|uniref:Uncharacterized protein n=1 Tax=Alternaria atra TaxID=119953 RepID=A0A8J2I692_9PLEO|nr:uncharacterized protein ALTATR162_LOCUS5126 [Alternaria atra]CAG5158529.1 unnamed protein product [Alternaria atra]